MPLQGLVTGIIIGGTLALPVMGVALIYGVTGVLNYSIAAVGVFGAFISWLLWSYGAGIALPVGLAVSFLIGYGLQAFLLNPLLKRGKENILSILFIVTFGVALVFSGLTKIIFPRPTISFELPRLGGVDIAGSAVDANRFVAIFVALAVLVAIRLLEMRTKTGKAWVATSQNLKLARLVGINAEQVFCIVSGMGYVFGYVGAMFWGGLYNLTVITGWDLTFLGYIIAVVGGIGNIWGGMLSALVMGIVMSYAGLSLGGNWQSVVLYGVLLIVLVISPKGILGSERSV